MRRLQLILKLPPRLQHPIQAHIGDGEAIHRTRLLYGNLLDDRATRFVFYVEGDRDLYTSVLDGLADIQTYEITPVEGGGFYSLVEREFRAGDRRLRTLLEGAGAVIVPPVEYTSDGSIRTTILGDPESLRSTFAELPSDVDVQLERASRRMGIDSSVTSILTDRQREAVAAAVDVGYYEVPREGRLQEVAQALDCASSTASNHLRKAEARIMSQVIASG